LATTSINHHSCITVARPHDNPPKERGSVYEIVTDRIITLLQQGTVPWRKPWRTDAPKSLATLKEYRGINALLLAVEGYASPYWLTFAQAQRLGGHIKQGEHSTLVTFWKQSPYKKHNDDTGEDETRHGFLLRYFRVFNLEQTECIADKLGLTGASPRVPSIETCERIVSDMPLAPKREQSNARGESHAKRSPRKVCESE
jgi:antirestriction protein ArdC